MKKLLPQRSVLLLWLIGLTLSVLAGGQAASAQVEVWQQAEAELITPDAPREPNLTAYTPAGWSYPIVPSSVAGTNVVNTLYAGQTTYIDWAVVNNGNKSVWEQFDICLYLDGSQIGSWYARRLRRGYYAYVEDWTYTVNNAGNHTLRVTVDCTNVIPESNESDNSWEHTFYWEGGGGNPIGIVISNQQGYDKCEIPSTTQMQTWWNSSPYYEANIYIGGSARACANNGLNAAWVSTVSNQGWNFIPTWVGPQAPCSAFSSRFSYDPPTAYNQGRSEANSAYNVASNLGLIAQGRNTIIYYDLEAFPGDAACREAAKSFISGWSGRLRELGQRAGAYGSACGSYVTDWVGITYVPDDVWLAHWIYNSYTPGATVWDVACVSNGYWSNHQRLRQYAGGHNETWGGVTFNIDSNAEDGHVAGVNPRNLAPVELAQQGVAVQDMQLLNAQQGWLLTPGKLLWTNDGGQTWLNITPAGIGGTPQAAAFVDAQHGWAARLTAPNSLAVARTRDGGQTWQMDDMLLFAPESGQMAAQVSFDFVSTQTGYLAVELQSGVNFSQGLLWQTVDGGQTWQPRSLPVAGAVSFHSERIGWVAGGSTGDELYRTNDGGHTWTPVTLSHGADRWFTDLPIFVNQTTGWLPVTVAAGAESQVLLYATRDGGLTWTLAQTIPLAQEPTMKASLQLIDGQLRLAGQLTPAGAAQMTWSGLMGWAQTTTNHCQGQKVSALEPFRCVTEMKLWRTTDGGQNWVRLDIDSQ